MSKVKVNELSKHDASEITVNDDVVLASGKSVSSPSISTDTISEKTSAAGVTIDGVLIKDSKLASGTGNVLQVVNATDTTVASYSIAANGSQKLGSLEVSITPSSTSSSILLLATVNTGKSGRYNSLNFYRDSTVLGMSDQATGSRTNAGVYLNSGEFTDITYQCLATSMQFLDSPSSTSAITYSVYVTRRHSTDTVYYNRPENDTDAAYIMRTMSNITAIEVGG